MSALESAEEKKQIEMRLFDFAEEPVKEWIADFLGEPPETIFSDYRGEADVCAVSDSLGDKNRQATVYLSLERDNDSGLPPPEHVNARRAMSMMYDAVFTVYVPVVATMTNMRHRLENLMPRFDDHRRCFELCMVNTIAAKKKQLEQTALSIHHHLTTKTDLTDEDKQKLTELRTKYMTDYNEITAEQIAAEEERVVAFNNNKNDSVLYIVVETGPVTNEDLIARRLPRIDRQYEDADEETLTEKIKRGLVDV